MMRPVTTSRMPTDYPHGGPLFWMDETSGELRDAVTAYLESRESLAQLRLVIDYCAYWIQAPCWRSPTDAPADLEQLRKAVQRITTRQALSTWLTEAMALGIDPL